MDDEPGPGEVAERGYHVVAFTRPLWRRFRETGSTEAGFRSGSLGRTRRFSVGDVLLCYVVDGVGFVGALLVAGPAFETDDTSAWGTGDFPLRVPVEVSVALPEDEAVRVPDLLQELPRIRAADEKQPGAWGNFVRGAPRRWPSDEAVVVLEALTARANPSETASLPDGTPQHRLPRQLRATR